jgi:hypothetical protein
LETYSISIFALLGTSKTRRENAQILRLPAKLTIRQLLSNSGLGIGNSMTAVFVSRRLSCIHILLLAAPEQG